jgi:colicin import membrane protein
MRRLMFMHHRTPLLCGLLVLLLWAPPLKALNEAAERERIAAERAAVNARYAQDEADCRQRFAVRACLEPARERRRRELESLRQQELLLNEQRRRERAAERERAVREKRAQQERR